MLLEQPLNGLTIGGIYALIALGYSVYFSHVPGPYGWPASSGAQEYLGSGHAGNLL
ncbi:MAG: hypothetical protein JG781_2658 [Peptococcaceae bacterium]|nr:hypothetical protein [Peptococcaceae bacterium]